MVKVSNDTLFYASVTLKAQWTKLSDTPKTFTITLDANGGTLSGAATVTTNAGGKAGQCVVRPLPTRSDWPPLSALKRKHSGEIYAPESQEPDR